MDCLLRLDFGEKGYAFNANVIYYDTFSFLLYCNKYNFSILVFSKLLSRYNPEDIGVNVRYVAGFTGMIERSIEYIDLGCNINHFKWVIENCPVVPTVKKDCRKAKDVYSNSIPQIKEIAGNYLPIIDIEDCISDSWQTYLGLKNHLTLDDYLFLLTEFVVDSKMWRTTRLRLLAFTKNNRTRLFEVQSAKNFN